MLCESSEALPHCMGTAFPETANNRSLLASCRDFVKSMLTNNAVNPMQKASNGFPQVMQREDTWNPLSLHQDSPIFSVDLGTPCASSVTPHYAQAAFAQEDCSYKVSDRQQAYFNLKSFQPHAKD